METGCQTIACYSWKGGTGRSTAACNIATCLAAEGKNVLLIDLDVEAPGLYQVLDIEEKDLCIYSISDFLREPLATAGGEELVEEPIGVDELLETENKGGIIDIGEYWAHSNLRQLENGKLYLIPAVPGSIQIPFGKGSVEQKLRGLLLALKSNKELDLDYIILDSASGLRGSSLVAMFPSDLILVFFRWTRQHLRGAVNSATWITYFEDQYDRFTADYLLIANCVPDEKEFMSLSREEAAVYKGIFHNAQRFLNKELGKKGFVNEKNTISEILPLKWRDEVIVLDDEGSRNSQYNDYWKITDLIAEWVAQRRAGEK